jgi:hypothetical protein
MKYVLVYMILTNGMNSGITGTAEFNTLEACEIAATSVVAKSISMSKPEKKMSKTAQRVYDAYPKPWADCLPKGLTNN